MPDPIYLDYNATTPIAPDVAAAMRPFLDGIYGNPSSTHVFGIEARTAVERARGQVADLLGCERDEIIFTSGGSESDNLAIVGTARALRERGRHIITSAVDHPAVLEACRFLEREGYVVTYLPVDETGLVDPAAVEAALRSDTILVTIMHANNEVGTIEPIAEIAGIVRSAGVRLHSDGAQAVGKIPARVAELGVDLYTIAGHKLYAPKGVGALYQRRGVELAPLIVGAGHEMGRRAGTENVLEIVGLGAAAELAARDLEANSRRMAESRDRLQALLTERFSDARVNGHPDLRLPNTLSISFPNLEANGILDELFDVGASPGAACHSDTIQLSHVLEAMGVPEAIAMGTIRFSTGRSTTVAEVEEAAERIIGVIERMRGPSGEEDETGAEPVALEGPVKLTRFTHGLGCACKIRPQTLEKILARLPRAEHPALMVGTETADDAAVYRLNDELAVVETVDFFTPIVDSPRDFGAIATANALSDIYAMGAEPIFALNLVGFPVGRLPQEVLEEILQGASEKAAEAGVPIVGGHSVEDTEPKFGMAVTGIVHPDRVLTNRTALPGDALVLTKPIGTGIMSTAAKRGAASEAGVALATRLMSTLNREAARVMADFEVSACTDVTGFGLIGHLLEMTRASEVEAEVAVSAVPILDEAREWAQAGIVPGGTRDNLAHVAPHLEWDPAIPEVERLLLCDAQTSGGLLISLPSQTADALLEALHSAGVEAAARIGRITGPGQGRITVRPQDA